MKFLKVYVPKYFSTIHMLKSIVCYAVALTPYTMYVCRTRTEILWHILGFCLRVFEISYFKYKVLPFYVTKVRYWIPGIKQRKKQLRIIFLCSKKL